MGRRSLSERQRKFCDAYMARGAAMPAAIDAGYAPTYANAAARRLLQHPAVAKEIARRQADASARADISTAEFLDQLREDRRFAFETGNATAAARCTELMAKLCGKMVDRHTLDARVASFSLSIEGVQFEPAPGERVIEHEEPAHA